MAESTSCRSQSWLNWWQQCVKLHLTSFVQSEFERVVPSALAQAPKKEPPMFHRSEIVTGRRLGSGGFSHVFEIRAFNLRDDISAILTPSQRDSRQMMVDSAVVDGRCQYAIKHLHRKLLNNTDDFMRAAADLAIEASFLSTLEHPNIVSLQGTSLNGLLAYMDGGHDSFFLVMERLEETLESRVERWRNDEDADLSEKVELSQQLAEALRYLHQRRIVFRDLKPANIGLSSVDGTIKLFDFGLCREMPTEEDSTNDIYQMSGVGTRRYMAVEAVLQKPYNCKADVYGWSMIFWEMLMLTKPFSELTYEEHTKLVCEGGERPSLSSNLPHSVQRLLEHCWVECVSDRFCMDEVCHQLVAIEQELFQSSTSTLSVELSQEDASTTVISLFTGFGYSTTSVASNMKFTTTTESLALVPDSIHSKMDSTDFIFNEWSSKLSSMQCATAADWFQNNAYEAPSHMTPRSARAA